MQNLNGMKHAPNLGALIDAEPGHFYQINVEIEATSGGSAVNDPITLVGSLGKA